MWSSMANFKERRFDTADSNKTAVSNRRSWSAKLSHGSQFQMENISIGSELACAAVAAGEQLRGGNDQKVWTEPECAPAKPGSAGGTELLLSTPVASCRIRISARR